jgi:hypothetical protein
MIRVFILLTKLLACAQVNINMLQTQMAEAEYAFLTGLTGFGEIQTQSEALLPEKNSEVRRSK